jgi:hypothetical protein
MLIVVEPFLEHGCYLEGLHRSIARLCEGGVVEMQTFKIPADDCIAVPTTYLTNGRFIVTARLVISFRQNVQRR